MDSSRGRIHRANPLHEYKNSVLVTGITFAANSSTAFDQAGWLWRIVCSGRLSRTRQLRSGHAPIRFGSTARRESVVNIKNLIARLWDQGSHVHFS